MAEKKNSKAVSVFMIIVKAIFGVLVLVVLTLVAVLLFNRVRNTFWRDSLYEFDQYHIVFMDNNLFYFCKLSDYNAEYIECREPYYLVRKKVDNEDGTTEEKVYIRKPSEEEIYVPEGSIYLKKDGIVYIAKLSDDSPVLDYIDSKN